MFCRGQVHDQFKFLKQNVLEQSRVAYIFGPPGTGKSTTTLAFALSDCAKDWVVTWIHPIKTTSGGKVLMKCARIRNESIETIHASELKELLEDVVENHFVIIDGYNKDHETIWGNCLEWFSIGDGSRKRLLCVSSMSSGLKMSPDDKGTYNFQSYPVYSWIPDEFLEAIEDDDFFNSVKENLDAGILQESVYEQSEGEESKVEQSDADRKDLVLAKYHFAGGSSRLMFSYTTEEAIKYLKEGVDSVKDISSYLDGYVGPTSEGVVNRLLGLLSHDKKSTTTFITSEFVVLLCAEHMGPEKVIMYAQHLSQLGNPALMGWVFEMLFFSILRDRVEGVKMFDRNNKKHKWPKATPVRFDPLTITAVTPILPAGWWGQPVKWNQGGYDAVLINRVSENAEKHNVTFVQVASGVKHDLKLYCMHALLRRLQTFLPIGKVEVVFVVPKGKIAAFEIGDPTGTLVDYGWEKGEEKGTCKIWALNETWEFE